METTPGEGVKRLAGGEGGSPRGEGSDEGVKGDQDSSNNLPLTLALLGTQPNRLFFLISSRCPIKKTSNNFYANVKNIAKLL